MSATTPVVCYYRASTTKQEASIPEQRRWAEQACRRHDVRVLREFEDEGVTGDEIERRRGLQDLLAYCEQQYRTGKPVGAIVVWDADRFSRANSFATAAVLDRLMAIGVRHMITNAEGWIDFEDDMQRVFFNLRQDLGKRAYSKSVSGAVSRTRADRSREGFWTGGPPPFGYILGPDNRLALGEDGHVEAVRRVFREYLARDVGAYQLADDLQAAGVPFPVYRGRKRWTDDLVYQILTNPQYTGDLYYNRTSTGKHHRTLPDGRIISHRRGKTRTGTAKVVCNCPEEYIVSRDAHPAIIDRTTFEAVQKKLASRKQGGGVRRSDYPFSGLVQCGECGATMYGITVIRKYRGKRYEWRKYACSRYMQTGGKDCHYNTVLEQALLDRVAEVLEERFGDENALAELRARYLARRKQHSKTIEKDVRRLRKQRDDLAGQIARGTRNLALAKTAKDFERVSAAISGWEAEREKLGNELRDLEQTAQADLQSETDLGKALAQLQEVGRLIRTSDPNKVQRVARGLVEKIELRFDHKPLRSGKTRTICVGGDIHLRGDLGCSPMPSEGSPIW